MKKNILKNLLNFCLVLVIIVTIFTFSTRETIKYDISYDSDFQVASPVKISIEIKKGSIRYTPKEMDLLVYNKYNKDERFETKLTAFEEGKYFVVLTPNFTGEYLLTLNLNEDSNTNVFTSSFTIK